jgi:hypothetical protein
MVLVMDGSTYKLLRIYFKIVYLKVTMGSDGQAIYFKAESSFSWHAALMAYRATVSLLC